MKIVIILPTYNEKNNIVSIIKALFEEFKSISHNMDILIVDDNSPDGTGEVVQKLINDHKNLFLLSGTKKGIGAAYIRGIKYAISALKADAIFEMDADFSHNPKDILRFTDALDSSADFVIGSRYVAGGSIPEEWKWSRKLVSRYGNIVARYIAGIYQVQDCTAGFRAIRSTIIKEIDLSKLRVHGYAFQVALLHQAVLAGANIKEIPVDFIDRKYGESKLGFKDIIEFIFNAWWIRLNSLEVFIRYGIVGFSGVLINLGLFALFLSFGTNKYAASLLAIAFSIIWNFILNHYWTFTERKAGIRNKIKGLKFNLLSLDSLSLSFLTFFILCTLLPQKPLYLNQFISIFPAIIANYFLDTYWTFKGEKDA